MAPDPPTQMEGADGLTVIVGNRLTVMVAVAEFEQPFASVPVTTYDVVVIGFAVGLEITADDRPVDGDHEWEAAPEATSAVPAPPIQIDTAEGLTETLGNGFTVTVLVAVTPHPVPT